MNIPSADEMRKTTNSGLTDAQIEKAVISLIKDAAERGLNHTYVSMLDFMPVKLVNDLEKSGYRVAYSIETCKSIKFIRYQILW